MGALENSKTWIPYMKSKECTQQICSLSCPQWCYIIFPPPPPFAFPEDNSQKGITFSPLVIAIIGILASAFLLVSYYAIISKYCGNSESSRRRENRPRNEELEEEVSNVNDHDHEFSQHEPWFISTNGLDEALIKNITLVKYKKEDGLIGSTDCSVCLGEFLEDDSLRLLPKCSHAFHVACIDAWLKSHSNCPLCRANIVSVSVSVQPVIHPPPILVVDDHINDINAGHTQDQLSSSQNRVANEEISSSGEGSECSHKNPFRTFSDLAGLGLRQSSHVTSLTHHEGENVMRRSFSMDHSHEMSVTVSISDMLRLSHGEDCQVEDCQAHDQTVKMAVAESSKYGFRNTSTSSNNSSRYGGLFGVVNSVGLKRSFSSGRFLFSKHGRGSNAVTFCITIASYYDYMQMS